MLNVRTATIDDADDLAQTHVQGWRVGYRGVFPDEYLDAPEFERERLERWRAWTWGEFGASELYVAELDGRVVGFSHFGPEREQPECDQSGTDQIDSAQIDAAPSLAEASIGEVYGFYLHPDAWGSGAAAALMERSVERLAGRHYTAAVLWVLRDNPRARGFYEKAGWSATGRSILWEGPQTATKPPDPVTEVQYRRSLAQVAPSRVR